MIQELKEIINSAINNQAKGNKNVLVSLVYLDGSSYRKPGVRMLMSDKGDFTGAISGGCVEKEVFKRASSVFQTGKSKVITYDGRYRLGCEGLLYILIEPFEVNPDFSNAFNSVFEKRIPLKIDSYYVLKDDEEGNFGTEFYFENTTMSANPNLSSDLSEFRDFEDVLAPCFKLIIIGSEHDTLSLFKVASLLGWEIELIAGMNSDRSQSEFEGINSFKKDIPENLDISKFDKETAVVLMTHNYALDLKYLIKLVDSRVCYVGILGSKKRKVKLEDDLFVQVDDLNDEFLEKCHSPAGLNIGAESPAEISLSIVAEILEVYRNKEIPA